ncbi:MAG: glycoside hydrolase family 10 protein [Mangrovibacterium sp.]
MRIPLLCLLLLMAIFRVEGQGKPPKYEFRAAWVATVNNIDWPSRPGLTPEAQQQEALALLDRLQQTGFNAVIFQGRPASDAFYPSELEPWSRYLTGTPGKNPGYDPLAFWIRECHRRNMEFHLWCNPFRVAQNAGEPLAASHIAFSHPEWIVTYGGKLYFNPGLPEVRIFISEVVRDIVSRYDVDAIHFDDYFYPYPVAGVPFPDLLTYHQHPGSFRPEQINDWRRNNVDETICLLARVIKEPKPWVKFGISPFGVWRNQSDDSRGSLTAAGITNYDGLYADILKWLQNGWIDYVLPQLYWHIGHPAANFELLCRWWNANRFNRTLYIGQALYKSGRTSAVPEWRQASQLPRQIRMMRKFEGIQGGALYSAKHLERDLMGFQDSLQQDLYALPALIPPMPWIDDLPPRAPRRFRRRGTELRWKTPKFRDETDRPVCYIVYINQKGEACDPSDPRSILLITRSSRIRLKPADGPAERFEFRVSALDRLSNESKLSRPVRLNW